MSPYFERYISDCKRLGYKPTLKEKQLHEALGIKDEVEHTPLMVRPKKDARLITPSLEVHTKKPVERKLRKRTDKRVRKTDRIMSPKISRKNMTDEEIRERKNQTRRDWWLRNKENIKLSRTIEDHEAELKRRKAYYKENRQKILDANKKWNQENKEKVKIIQQRADAKRGKNKNANTDC